MGRNKADKCWLLTKEINVLTGIFLWKFFFRFYHGSEKGTFFLLVPKSSDMEIYYLMLYVDQLLGGKKRLVVLAEDIRAYRWIKELADRKCQRHKICSVNMKKLIAAFPYIGFQSQVLTASVDLPTGRHGRNLLGKDHISFEELFAVGVLKIKQGYYDESLRPDKIRYHGPDYDLRNFIDKMESKINECT